MKLKSYIPCNMKYAKHLRIAAVLALGLGALALSASEDTDFFKANQLYTLHEFKDAAAQLEAFIRQLRESDGPRLLTDLLGLYDATADRPEQADFRLLDWQPGCIHDGNG